MKKPYTLQSETAFANTFVTRSGHDTYAEAIEEAETIHDSGFSGDFRIVDNSTGKQERISGHLFDTEKCRLCGAICRKRNMVYAYLGYKGQPALVCFKCHEENTEGGYCDE